MLVMALGPTVWIFAAGFTFLGFSHGIVPPIRALLVARSIAPSKRVLANSVVDAGYDFGILAGPLAASILIPILGLGLVIALFASVPLALTLPVRIAANRAPDGTFAVIPRQTSN